MIAWVFGPLSLLAWWAILTALAVGVGLFTSRLLRRTRLIDVDALFTSFWLGIATVVLLLQLWHFALPVTVAASIACLAVGTFGLIRNASQIWLLLRSLPSRQVWVYLGIWTVVGWLFANRAIGELAFDTLMYHVPAVEWFKAYAIVPGLANLQPRFGYNNSTFLIAAMLEGGVWQAGSQLLLNGTLIMALFGQILLSIRRLQRKHGGRRVRQWFDALLLIPIMSLAVAGMVGGLDPDHIVGRYAVRGDVPVDRKSPSVQPRPRCP